MIVSDGKKYNPSSMTPINPMITPILSGLASRGVSPAPSMLRGRNNNRKPMENTDIKISKNDLHINFFSPNVVLR
nr:hypothetical protein [Candidatus Sigynarchaeota archaeon]